jgi:ABC-2 type transport system permease protein
MTATTLTTTPTDDVTPPAVVHRAGFGAALHAEWIKLATVRSTWWTIAALFVLGAGLTTLICGANADWLASDAADESPGSFLTWGMMLAPICAVVLGALVVSSEYSTGMIRATFAAVPSRGTVIAAKAVLLTAILFVVGTLTALVGYVGGNYFLDREGIGMALEGDVLRAMYGSGLYVAGVGLLTAAVGFLVRHTAGTISIVLALLLVIGNMVMLVPGSLGDVLMKVMPGNAGSAIASPAPFNPDLLGAWTGLGVFAAEIAVLLGLAWFVVRRRDA